jgi:hypothetical protein
MLRFQAVENFDHDVILLLEMKHDGFYFLLCFQIDFIVMLRHQAIFVGLSILGHHYDRSRVCSLKAQREVQQDERIGVPVADVGDHIKRYPSCQDHRLDDDERPAPDDLGHLIGYSVTDSQRSIMLLVDIHNGSVIVFVAHTGAFPSDGKV